MKLINMTTLDGVKLNTKNKFCDDDIQVQVSSELEYKGEIESGAVFEDFLTQIIEGTMTELVNDRATSVKDYAFYKNTLIEKIDLKNVINIGQYAFNTCRKIKTLNLPNVKTIGTSAFQYCTGITKIELNKIETLESNCLQHCASLKSLVIRNTEKVCTMKSSNVLGGSITESGGFVYVPDNLVDSYKNATNWSSYINFIKPLSEYVEEW